MRRLFWLCLSLLLMFLSACSPAEPTEVVVLPLPNRILDFWQTERGRLEQANQRQPFQFLAARGDAIRLSLEADTAAFTLELLAPDGALLQRGYEVRATLPSDGLYTVNVMLTQPTPGDFAVTLIYTDRPDPALPTATPTLTPTPTAIPTITPIYDALGTYAGELASTREQTSAFSRKDERHVYTFTGDEGQFANVRVDLLDGEADPLVALYDPDGRVIAADDNSGGDLSALLQNILLTRTGEYSIQVGNEGERGEYRLSLSLAPGRLALTPVIPLPTATATATFTPAPQPDRLVDHLPTPGRIARPGGFARYPIFVEAGQIFTVGVSPVAGADLPLRVELYNPLGELMQVADSNQSNAAGDALLPAMRAAETGVHVALVQAIEAQTGDFVIAYGLGNSRENILRGVADVDGLYLGEVTRRGLRDLWTVYLHEGDLITATADPQDPNFDPVLELVTADGDILALDDNSGGGRTPVIASVRAPFTGAYTLRVTGAHAASSGVYTLIWRQISAAPTATPAAATIRLLTADAIMPRQQYLEYAFQAQRGQRVLIQTQALEGSLDLVAALLDANGTVLVQADDNGESLSPVIEAIIPNDGTYLLRLNAYGETEGPFTLTIDALYDL